MTPRYVLAPLLTLGLLFLLATPAQATNRFQGKQLRVGTGTVVAAGDALTISANPNGRIFVSIDARGIQLDDFTRIGIEFEAVPRGAQVFIAWKTASGQEGLRQFPAPTAPEALSLSMACESTWTGAAGEIGLGILIPAGNTASVKSISLLAPTLLSAYLDRLREWTAFRGWRASDINFYTGTHIADQSCAPVPLFALALGMALTAYLGWLLVSGKRARFNWRVAGGLLLACWISLDLMWQVRLGAQVADTRAVFAGKDSTEKLMSSGDATVVSLAAAVKAALQGDSPRVFLASDNDYGAMLSAYYLAPVNTYWHRHGPELPDHQYLATGDYILLVPPFRTPYHAGSGFITLPDASQVAVERILRHPAGMLLQVI